MDAASECMCDKKGDARSSTARYVAAKTARCDQSICETFFVKGSRASTDRERGTAGQGNFLADRFAALLLAMRRFVASELVRLY